MTGDAEILRQLLIELINTIQGQVINKDLKQIKAELESYGG